jgi:hypothetical protein
MKNYALALISLAGVIGCSDGSSAPTADQQQTAQQERILKEGTAQVGMPSIVHGVTAKGGKLTYLGQTIGYGIPYATQFTAPMKPDYNSGQYNGGNLVLPQADPNGLFSPASAEGTWIMMKDPNGDDVKPVYVEPRILTLPFKLPSD